MLRNRLHQLFRRVTRVTYGQRFSTFLQVSQNFSVRGLTACLDPDRTYCCAKNITIFMRVIISIQRSRMISRVLQLSINNVILIRHCICDRLTSSFYGLALGNTSATLTNMILSGNLCHETYRLSLHLIRAISFGLFQCRVAQYCFCLPLNAISIHLS